MYRKTYVHFVEVLDLNSNMVLDLYGPFYKKEVAQNKLKSLEKNQKQYLPAIPQFDIITEEDGD